MSITTPGASFDFFAGFIDPARIAAMRSGRVASSHRFDGFQALVELALATTLAILLVGITGHQAAFLRERVVPEDLERLSRPAVEGPYLVIGDVPVAACIRREFKVPDDIKERMLAQGVRSADDTPDEAPRPDREPAALVARSGKADPVVFLNLPLPHDPSPRNETAGVQPPETAARREAASPSQAGATPASGPDDAAQAGTNRWFSAHELLGEERHE